MMLHTACCSAAYCKYKHIMITLYNKYNMMLHTAAAVLLTANTMMI